MIKKLFLLLIFIIILSILSCSETDQAPPKPEVPVKTAIAFQKDMPEEITTIGTVEAYAMVNITSRVDGQVMKIHIREGQDVQQGQLLINIDERPYQAMLESALSTLARDRIRLEKAKKDAQRYAELLQKDYVTKIQAEQVCHQFRESGLCVPILRPKSFVGPERLGVFAIFYEWASEGKNFPNIGSGNNRYQLLDVEDLCEAIHACMTLDENVVNDTFNIAATEFTTMKGDYQAVLDEAGFGKKIIPFPAGPVVLALRVLEALKLSPLYPWIYETASKDSFVSVEKAQKKLNYQPKYSNQQAMIRNYHWYLANRERLQAEPSTGVTHRVPWKQKALKWVKVFF